MRPIKFRAWDKVSKKMWDVEELSWCDSCFICANPGLDHMDIQDRDSRTKRVPMDIELMQFTGLKDNTKWEQLNKAKQEEWIARGETKETWNGVEIYEGDIVWNNHVPNDYDEIVFHNSAFKRKFIDRKGLYKGKEYYGGLNDNLEVMGNIYENKGEL